MAYPGRLFRRSWLAWTQDPVKGPEAMNAFLQMKKFELETLRAIAG